jgi:hypothetical protein
MGIGFNNNYLNYYLIMNYFIVYLHNISNLLLTMSVIYNNLFFINFIQKIIYRYYIMNLLLMKS